MSANSAIEWTEHTWNPIVGCSIVSPGCTNCYAMKMADRLQAMAPKPNGEGNPHLLHYAGTTSRDPTGRGYEWSAPVWTGKLKMAPDETLAAPLRRKKPTAYFVNSMGDLFHEDAPDEWIDRCFAVMALAPQHTFQILTKRPERMKAYLASVTGVRHVSMADGSTMRFGPWSHVNTPPPGAGIGKRWPLPNVWLGVSAERQKEADERIPLLLETPAATRFVSCEPLLGPIDLTVMRRGPSEVDLTLSGLKRVESYWCDALTGQRGVLMKNGDVLEAPGDFGPKLDWIIVGGESGAKARPMHPDWARSLRDQCTAVGVPFFFKQWGAWQPHTIQAGGDLGGDTRADRIRIVHPSARDGVEIFLESGGARQTEKGSRYMERVGKAAAGRLLDGREWNEFPTQSASP